MNNCTCERNRTSRAIPFLCASVVWASVSAGNIAFAGAVYEVGLDTSAFAGQSGAIQMLAFDLIGGDAQSGNNVATASNFQTDGGLLNASRVVLQDSTFFNEELRTITFGHFLTFNLTLTDNHTPPGFDEFSFLVLDSAGQLPLVHTTDPTGADVLFAIDINGSSGGALAVYDSLTENFSWTVKLTSAGVPDGGGFALELTAVLALLTLTTLMDRRDHLDIKHRRSGPAVQL
jgi:hypothetical protein